MTLFRLLIPLILLACLAVSTARADDISLGVNDVEFPLRTFEAGPGSDRLLWIPSEYGVQPPAYVLAGEVAAQGLSVWVADLHTTYFIPPGRSSLFGIPQGDIAELIDEAMPEDGRLFLLSSGRGAALTLLALHILQQQGRLGAHFGGVILLHPNLLEKTPAAGEPASYLPVASASNLPIYIIQPVNSAKRWYLKDLLQALRQGGSDVFTHAIRGAGDGYQVRPVDSPEEAAQRDRLPGVLVQATQALTPYSQVTRNAVPLQASGNWSSTPHASMQPWRDDPTPPALSLTGLDGRRHELGDAPGQVTLINFWATWCPPCVEELPALQRLRDHMQGRDFRLLSVDVGEPADDVRRFIARHKVELPVLLDSDGRTFRAWRLRAFPSTFILDRHGNIRYGHFGALAWDSPEIVKLVEGLLAEGE